MELTYEKTSFSLKENVIPLLLGDMRRLKQVLMNLIKNAMKFTPEGKIQVYAKYNELPESMLTVNITDTGVGIAAEDMASLFTRFGKL